MPDYEATEKKWENKINKEEEEEEEEE